MDAGKDVYCEKPMTTTIAEANAVVDAAQKTNQVMTVGVQSMADPTWRAAYEYIRAGNIGHVIQGQTSYFRNSQRRPVALLPADEGHDARRRSTGTCSSATTSSARASRSARRPKEMPFDRAVCAQWRCYWPFGGGMFTDLFVHQTTHLIAAMGVRFPARVVGGGGIYLEYDGRDVPDVATIVADYDEGCQLIISATMCNDMQLGEMIRGHLATIKFTGGGDFMQGLRGVRPEHRRRPGQAEGATRRQAGPHLREPEDAATRPTPCGRTSWTTCRMDDKAKPRDAQHAGTRRGRVHHGEHGRAELPPRQGAVLGQGEASPEGRRRHAGRRSWEARSKKRGKPNQIIGWKGGDTGSTARAAGVPEARRPVGQRQGPGGVVNTDWTVASGRVHPGRSLFWRAGSVSDRRMRPPVAHAPGSPLARRLLLPHFRIAAYAPPSSLFRSWRTATCRRPQLHPQLQRRKAAAG